MRIVRADASDRGCNTDSEKAVSLRPVSQRCRQLCGAKSFTMNIVWNANIRWIKCKVAPINFLSAWCISKHASLEFETHVIGVPKVTHAAARFTLIKPEPKPNLLYSVALNRDANVHSHTLRCLTQIQTAAEPESLSLSLSVPELHSGGCFLVEHQEKPSEVKCSFTGRVPELKESRDETVGPSNALDMTSCHRR